MIQIREDDGLRNVVVMLTPLKRIITTQRLKFKTQKKAVQGSMSTYRKLGEIDNLPITVSTGIDEFPKKWWTGRRALEIYSKYGTKSFKSIFFTIHVFHTSASINLSFEVTGSASKIST